MTSGLFTLLEADEPPDVELPLLVHHGIAEAFYALEDEVRHVPQRRRVPLSSGFVHICPAKTTHGFRVGDVPSRQPNIHLPAAMVGRFDELIR